MLNSSYALLMDSTAILAPAMPHHASLSSSERLKLVQTLNGLPPTQFEEIVTALRPPGGILPANGAAQGNRASALLHWIEGPTGPGLSELQTVLDLIFDSHSIEKKHRSEKLDQEFYSDKKRGLIRKKTLRAIASIITLTASIVTVMTILTIPEVRHYLKLDSPNLDQDNSDAQIQTYQLNTHQIELEYSKEWEVQKVTDPIDNTVLKLVFSGEESEGIGSEIFIIIEDIGKNPLSLKEQTDFIVSLIENNLPKGEIIQLKKRTFMNRPGYEIIYTGEINNQEIKAMRVGTLEGYKIYELIYITSSNIYEEHEEAVEMIIDSFKVMQN